MSIRITVVKVRNKARSPGFSERGERESFGHDGPGQRNPSSRRRTLLRPAGRRGKRLAERVHQRNNGPRASCVDGRGLCGSAIAQRSPSAFFRRFARPKEHRNICAAHYAHCAAHETSVDGLRSAASEREPPPCSAALRVDEADGGFLRRCSGSY